MQTNTTQETPRGLVETLGSLQWCSETLQPEGTNRFFHIRVVQGNTILRGYETFENLEFAVREGYVEKQEGEFGPFYRPIGNKLKEFLEQRH